MSLIYKNITGNTEVYIEDIQTYNITDINLCNVHDTDAVLIDLYLRTYIKDDVRMVRGENGNFDDINIVPTDYYIIKNLEVAKGVTLHLSENYPKNVNYHTYRLYIKLNNSDSKVDMIISGNKNNRNIPEVGSNFSNMGSNY